MRVLALALLGDVFGQSGLVAGRCVLVDQALVDCLVDKRHGRIKKLTATLFVTRRQRGAKPLDLRTQLTTIASVYLVTFRILSNALF